MIQQTHKRITVLLDMDGTIADLYGIENWLPRLRNSDENIFLECAPMVTQEVLFETFPQDKFEIKIKSMTPLGATVEYCENVIKQKTQWLKKYFPKIENMAFLEYGEDKKEKGSRTMYLVDDSEKIRTNFDGVALNPKNLW